MRVTEALAQRKSTRAFLNRQVERETIVRILKVARHAPSGANTQPWQVAVVTGETRERICSALEEAFRRGEKGRMDYAYYPDTWEEPYAGRRRECGRQLYEALGIGREEKEKRIEQWVANYHGFGAPVILFYFLDGRLATGSFMDCGMFLQSVMLAALEEGVATCPQAALAEYPDIVKEELRYPPEMKLLCGMAMGYEDAAAAINGYRTSRDPVESFTCFFPNRP